MKIITSTLYLIFILFFIWIIYLTWLIFDSSENKTEYSSIRKFREELNVTLFNLEDEQILVYDRNGSVDIMLNTNYTPAIWEKMETFEDFENNVSKREFKERFEELLAMYLDIDTLFSNSEIERADKLDFFYDIVVSEYINFYGVLYIYIKYLQQNPSIENQKMLYKIFDKNLKNFQQLMKNSNTFFDYLISISFLKTNISLSECSSEMIYIFKKYPPLEPKLFFKKLKLKKKKALKVLSMLQEKRFKSNSFQRSVLNIYISNIFDDVYKREAIAIRDGSDKAIDKFKAYIEKIKVDSKEWDELLDLTLWFRHKKEDEANLRAVVNLLILYTIKDDDFSIYQKHKLLNEEYKDFLGSCEELK